MKVNDNLLMPFFINFFLRISFESIIEKDNEKLKSCS